jgi:hypothetical protein
LHCTDWFDVSTDSPLIFLTTFAGFSKTNADATGIKSVMNSKYTMAILAIDQLYAQILVLQ